MKRTQGRSQLAGLRSSSAQWASDFEQLERDLNQQELSSLTESIKGKFQSLACNWDALVDTMHHQLSISRIVHQKRVHKEQRRKARTQELDVMEEELKDKEKTWQRSLQHFHSLLSSSLQKAEEFARKTTARRRKYKESQKVQIEAVELELLGLITSPSSDQETRLRPALAPHSPPRPPSPPESQVSEEYDRLMDELAAQKAEQVNESGISLDKDVGGWDSSLESEQPSLLASESADEIKRALMYLKKANLLSPVSFIQRNQHLLKQLGEMLADPKNPGDAAAVMLLIKGQQKKTSHQHQRKQSFPPKPPTPTNKPGWKRTLHITQPAEVSLDLADTTPKSELMQVVEGLLDKTLTSNPPQSTREQPEEPLWKPEDNSLQDVQLEDILKVPSFMGTEVTVQAEEEKAAVEVESGQTVLEDQVMPYREVKAPPSSTRKKRETTDYHYAGQTYQGSTRGSSGLKSKIALRTETEDSHFRLTGQSQSVLMTPQTKEKAL